MNKLLRNVTGGVKPACSKGFTLAEVLITLGIIGVVAALTIPSLINKCQKIVWANQAQETHAILTQAFKRILADNNTTSLSETELWSKIKVEDRISMCDNNYSDDEDYWKEFGKYVKISAKLNDCYDIYGIVLSSGVEFIEVFIHTKSSIFRTDEECKKIKALGGNMCSYLGFIEIDINGSNKRPNTFGRDRFRFVLSDEGVLYPEGGKDTALCYKQIDLASNTGYWKYRYSGTKEENAKKSQLERTGQLVEEGWKMNY
jgi:prepilin-type N-terminal cleavage/methylation domain-containing protein